MDTVVKAFNEYFEEELPKLSNTYKWTIPEIDGFSASGEQGYKPNVELKKFFNNKWHISSNQERMSLAKVIVSDWGRVINNKATTLEKYVNRFSNKEFLTPLSGVASYSKILSVIEPDEYAIYDARVAVTLNAVQVLKNIKIGLAFNYIPGRNKVTGRYVKKNGKYTKEGFVHKEEFKVKNLVANGWIRVPRNDTYATYSSLLKECLTAFPEYHLYDLEMVLFANAEKEAKRAMNCD